MAMIPCCSYIKPSIPLDVQALSSSSIDGSCSFTNCKRAEPSKMQWLEDWEIAEIAENTIREQLLELLRQFRAGDTVPAIRALHENPDFEPPPPLPLPLRLPLSVANDELSEPCIFEPDDDDNKEKEQVLVDVASVAGVAPRGTVASCETHLDDRSRQRRKLSSLTRLMNGFGLNGEERRYAKELIPIYKVLVGLQDEFMRVSFLSNDPELPNKLSRSRLFELFESNDPTDPWVCAAYPLYEVDADGKKTKKPRSSESSEKALYELHGLLTDNPQMPAWELLVKAVARVGDNRTTVAQLVRLLREKSSREIFRLDQIFHRAPETVESSDALFRGASKADRTNWQIVKNALDAYQQSHDDTAKGFPLSQLFGSNVSISNGTFVDVLRLRFGGVLTIASIGLCRPDAPRFAGPIKMKKTPLADAETEAPDHGPLVSFARSWGGCSDPHLPLWFSEAFRFDATRLDGDTHHTPAMQEHGLIL